MNRNERRTKEKNQKQPSTKVSGMKDAEYHKQQGMALKTEGKDTEAVQHLVKALELDSSFADAHFALAVLARTKPALKIEMQNVNKVIKNKTLLQDAYKKILYILKKRKQFKEALICQEELCTLLPDDLDEKANLGLILNILGHKESALRILAEVMDKDPDNNVYKSVFNGISGTLQLTQHEPLIKKALQRCFDDIYETNLAKSFPLWVNIVLHDPDCSGLPKAESIATYEDLAHWLDTATPSDLNFMRERIFLDGLRLITMSGPIEESYLKKFRRWVCLNSYSLSSKNQLAFFEPFLCAMGEQCFFNEYIYTPSAEENSLIFALTEKILKGEDTGMTQLQAYALVSCYRPLIEVFRERESELKALSADSRDFANVVKTQFLDLLQEEKIRKELENFGFLANEISKNVQAQYEEHPYPRWITVVKHPSPSDSIPIPEDQRNNPWKVLIAGCGTGRHALNAVAAYPYGKITAIDLSRASLAYGQRKAREASVADRIRFVHADILSMKDWPEQFDIIECSGVLHHMEDPFKGWEVLTDLLKPGGFFKVGLYSETARKQVVEARNYVSEHHYPPTLDGIRACRDAIFALPKSNPMREWLIGTGDFYATSLIRDLIFHVQEHRMTLPQIQEMMDNLGLIGKNFIVNNAETLRKYDRMFPADYDRSSLKNWHEFEQKYPDTFAGMYQFWCEKVK